MEIKFKTKRAEPIDDKVTIPTTRGMKSRLEQIKKQIDLNEMTRVYFEEVLRKVESGEYLNNAG